MGSPARRSASQASTLLESRGAATSALAAVTARAEQQAAAALLALADRAETPQSRTALLDLHRLFALRRLTGTSGLLLSHGQLTAGQVHALPELIDQELDRLAGQALALVDAFDLPEQVIGSHPIATARYQDAYDNPDHAWHRPQPAARFTG